MKFNNKIGYWDAALIQYEVHQYATIPYLTILSLILPRTVLQIWTFFFFFSLKKHISSFLFLPAVRDLGFELFV